MPKNVLQEKETKELFEQIKGLSKGKKEIVLASLKGMLIVADIRDKKGV